MAATTENLNMRETIEAWADITEKIWRDKMDKLQIGYSMMLEDGITHQIQGEGNMVSAVEFSFNYYGKFVDMGVGNGTKLGDVKENATSRRLEQRHTGNRRRPKPWYASTMYAERMKLVELLATKYAHRASIVIVENVDDNAMKWNAVTV